MLMYRGVASLTVLGGQEFLFPHIFLKFPSFFIFFLKLPHFCPHFGSLVGKVAHPERLLNALQVKDLAFALANGQKRMHNLLL